MVVTQGLVSGNSVDDHIHANRKLRERIARAIELISENPFFGVHIKKLKGKLASMYRYRLGNLKVLYEVHEDIKTVRIKVIEARGSAYK